MKTCTKCGEAKPLAEFYKDDRHEDGRRPVCKVCWAARRKRWYENNKARYVETDRKWQAEHKDLVAGYKQKWREENSQLNSELQKRYYYANKALQSARAKRWRKANPHKGVEYVERRRAAKLNATPSWADTGAISAIYAKAAELSAKTGVPHHVDHIVPLRGKTVCGLHVPSNLCVMPASANMSKGNHCWPDAWDDEAQLKYMML